MRAPLTNLPVIDFRPFRLGDLEARSAVARALGAACGETGFCYLTGHGIDDALVARTFGEARRFFALAEEVKQAIAIERSACHRGWFRLGGENLDPAHQRDAGDLKEGVKIGRDLPATHHLVQRRLPLHGPNQWPDLPGWRGAMQDYYDAMTVLGRQLMRAFALSLQLPECHFDALLHDAMATLGPLRYPPAPGEPDIRRLGAGAHSDFGCLTILAQDDTPGLQVKHRQGRWLEAPPLPGTFVLNVGDMLARWTNGRFASTVHRVINLSGRERYSLPFFFDPSFDAEVAALPGCTGPDDPPCFAPTTCGQYLLERIDESFSYHRQRPDRDARGSSTTDARRRDPRARHAQAGRGAGDPRRAR
jgi:isopenicillin N synthase-like dioxygenase